MNVHFKKIIDLAQNFFKKKKKKFSSPIIHSDLVSQHMKKMKMKMKYGLSKQQQQWSLFCQTHTGRELLYMF